MTCSVCKSNNCFLIKKYWYISFLEYNLISKVKEKKKEKAVVNNFNENHSRVIGDLVFCDINKVFGFICEKILTAFMFAAVMSEY